VRKTIPFTYLIGWSNYNKFYYGVKYSNGCSPDDLWKTYFTSSKYVKEFRDTYGEPDIVRVRKKFDTPEKATRWERIVLSKMDVLNRNDFLNENVAGSFIHSKQTLNKMRKTKKNNPNRGTTGRKWITDGTVSKNIHFNEPLPEGWSLGRKMPSDYVPHTTIGGKRNVTMWINNGKKCKRINIDEELPIGWVFGHIVKNPEKLKAATGMIWITDGINNRKVYKTDYILLGWKRGRVNSFQRNSVDGKR